MPKPDNPKNPSSSLDIFSEEAVQCPYHKAFEPIRETGQLVWSERAKAWVATDFELCKEILKDDTTFSSRNSIYGNDVAENLADEDVELIITMDGKKHTTVRKLIVDAFKLREIEEKWQPRAREIASEQLSYALTKDTFEVIKDLAVPLPVRLICEVLGIEYDTEKIWQIKKLTDAGICYLGHTNGDRFSPLEEKFMDEGAFELQDFLYDEIEHKRENPGDDLLTQLLTRDYEIDGELQKLDDERLMTYLSLILLAGNITTTNLIGQSLKYLSEHPGAWARIQADYSLIPHVVEETLRLEAPSKITFRQATRDVELAGVYIKQGEQILVALGAAGRDPEKYACPHAFDLDRTDQSHLSFGYKKHFCIGAGLARMEAKIALEEVCNTFSNLSIPENYTVRYLDMPLLRGLEELELAYTLR